MSLLVCYLFLVARTLQIFTLGHSPWTPMVYCPAYRIFQMFNQIIKIVKVYFVIPIKQQIGVSPFYSKPEVIILKKCEKAPQNKAYNECPKGITGKLVYEVSCNQYLMCWKGRGKIENCAPGTLFNPSTLECDSSHKVDCITGPHYNTPKPTALVTQTECPKGFSGIIPNYSNCSKFMHCEEGKTYSKDCPPGKLFDYTKNKCDDENSVKCIKDDQTKKSQRPSQQGPVCDPYQGCPINSGSAPRTPCGSIPNVVIHTISKRSLARFISLVPDHIRCDEPDGQQVHPFRCNLYLICSHGIPRVQKCPEGKLYNFKTERCENNVNYCKNHREASPEQTSKKPESGKTTSLFKTKSNFSFSLNSPSYYVLEYEDGKEPTLKSENSLREKNSCCQSGDFHCSKNYCVPRDLVCDGITQCPDGSDEGDCTNQTSDFISKKDHGLAVLEKERWDNVTLDACAKLCLNLVSSPKHVLCKSFNYDTIHNTCFLFHTNEGLSGALVPKKNIDYYEHKLYQEDCGSKHKCPNNKCIKVSQKCDGYDDCGDQSDEKNCKPEDFDYSLKLTGGNSPNRGKLEVTAFNRTGSICDDRFGMKEADVACRELGFNLGALEVKSNSFFMPNWKTENPIYMMDDVTCNGNETRLMDCKFNGWGVHNCLGQEVVGVACKTPDEKCLVDQWQCKNGTECVPLFLVCDGVEDCFDKSDESDAVCKLPMQVRVVNGTNEKGGRVELNQHGVWGTLCDHEFSEKTAKVVCKSLGFGKEGRAVIKRNGFFGLGKGHIWTEQLSCTGEEEKLDKCKHQQWGQHNCEHSEDVGVICDVKTEFTAQTSTTDRPPGYCGMMKDNIFKTQGSNILAERASYPWQAALRFKDQPGYWCGATVISPKFLLTAAHCLQGYSKKSYVVVAGAYDKDDEKNTEQSSEIEEFYIHEHFRKDHKMNNDIALIKLRQVFVFSEHVQPVCLPEPDDAFEAGKNCTISGYGSIERGKTSFSKDLRAKWIPMQSDETCNMPHVYGDALTEGMFCAGLLDATLNTCLGDSGGPLSCLKRGFFTLAGVTSWGQNCGYANKPGIYVKVAHYRKWIDDTFKKHSE